MHGYDYLKISLEHTLYKYIRITIFVFVDILINSYHNKYDETVFATNNNFLKTRKILHRKIYYWPLTRS